MVFARSRFRRRTKRSRMMGGPRRRFRGRRRRPMTAGKVKRIIDAELKVRDFSVEDVSIPSLTGTIVRITDIAQGDTNISRTGNWIKPVSFMGTITLVGNELADPTVVPLFRVGIFCWKENESLNAATIPQIMQDNVDPHQQFNIENKG